MRVGLLWCLPRHSVSKAHLLLHELLNLVDRDSDVRVLLHDLYNLLSVDNGLLVLEKVLHRLLDELLLRNDLLL